MHLINVKLIYCYQLHWTNVNWMYNYFAWQYDFHRWKSWENSKNILTERRNKNRMYFKLFGWWIALVKIIGKKSKSQWWSLIFKRLFSKPVNVFFSSFLCCCYCCIVIEMVLTIYNIVIEENVIPIQWPKRLLIAMFAIYKWRWRFKNSYREKNNNNSLIIMKKYIQKKWQTTKK